ncbi:hypothetical protein O7599_08085 [Streptomyces sp. WMMC500]|uniref:hypothetical protein n=1 Tax=Streptomyces sp. WMMC500 TaxID=3015154 RepID=UPI00248CDDD6|nr:hypothetical protein [Streptomyces sp. WMMC500]WBB62479.1 hypothetical protein O7599_08085 [Streptomyces sp. WMMC500]
MMPRDTDEPFDHAATGVRLAAEAALLEARAGLLAEAIDAVDARIEALSLALSRLRRTSATE